MLYYYKPTKMLLLEEIRRKHMKLTQCAHPLASLFDKMIHHNVHTAGMGKT